MKEFLSQILKDKNANFSLRELIIVLLMFAMMASWIGKQFFCKEVPEFMFYSFTSLIAASVFGYSIERKCNP